MITASSRYDKTTALMNIVALVACTGPGQAQVSQCSSMDGERAIPTGGVIHSRWFLEEESVFLKLVVPGRLTALQWMTLPRSTRVA